MSWLPGLACARAMPERHVQVLGNDFSVRGISATHSYNHHCTAAKGISDCTLHIKSAVFGFQKKRKEPKKKKEMKLGSVLLSCAFFR